MSIKGISARKLSKLLAILFVIYIGVSLLIIMFPKIQLGEQLTQIYKYYISPGPFFTASRVTKTTMCYLSWKVDGQWSQGVNPPLITYKKLFSQWNPTYMYQSRLERNIYEEMLSEHKKKADSLHKNLVWTSTYFQEHYVPEGVDSIRLILIDNVTERYTTKSDTIQILRF